MPDTSPYGQKKRRRGGGKKKSSSHSHVSYFFLRACARMTFHFLARVISKGLIQFALQAVPNPAHTFPHISPSRRSTLEHCCLIVFYCQSSGLFHPAVVREGGRNGYYQKKKMPKQKCCFEQLPTSKSVIHVWSATENPVASAKAGL